MILINLFLKDCTEAVVGNVAPGCYMPSSADECSSVASTSSGRTTPGNGQGKKYELMQNVLVVKIPIV